MLFFHYFGFVFYKNGLECWRCALFISSMHFVCMCIFFFFFIWTAFWMKKKMNISVTCMMITFNVLHFNRNVYFFSIVWWNVFKRELMMIGKVCQTVETLSTYIFYHAIFFVNTKRKIKSVPFNYHLENWVPCKWIHTLIFNEYHRLWKIMRRLMNNIHYTTIWDTILVHFKHIVRS